MARITFICQCLTGLEITEEFSFINVKYVLRLVTIDYFGQFFAFPVQSLFRDLQWHYLPKKSCIPGYVFSQNGRSSHMKPENC